MPISGLAVTFTKASNTKTSEARDAAVEAIAADPRVEVGESLPERMALVVETDSTDEDRLFWDWINNLPGVLLVEVAFIGFEEEEETPIDLAGAPKKSCGSQIPKPSE